jgi:hypothetical protein
LKFTYENDGIKADVEKKANRFERRLTNLYKLGGWNEMIPVANHNYRMMISWSFFLFFFLLLVKVEQPQKRPLDISVRSALLLLLLPLRVNAAQRDTHNSFNTRGYIEGRREKQRVTQHGVHVLLLFSGSHSHKNIQNKRGGFLFFHTVRSTYIRTCTFPG